MAQEIKPFPFYAGDPQAPDAEQPVVLKTLTRDRKREVAAYIADSGLVDAVNVALLLNQPLLLTGEPGTGKTQLAYSLGRELGYEVLKYETKSTSTARDLFYTYDTLRRFHDAQLEITKADTDYITYNALGIAIVLSEEEAKNKRWLPDSFTHGGPRRSIVLIDEIDKAPRDFPNDLLNEIEGMYFRVPELGMGNERIAANDSRRPVVIITSNSEKSLPDAFLRRCIFYHIPFPKRGRLKDIVLSQMSLLKDERLPWLEDALDFFEKLREENRGLDKKPATAELLNWLAYLRNEPLGEGARLRDRKELVGRSLSALFKSVSDQERAAEILEEWAGEPTR